LFHAIAIGVRLGAKESVNEIVLDKLLGDKVLDIAGVEVRKFRQFKPRDRSVPQFDLGYSGARHAEMLGDILLL
jgi:hypothetical protein